MTDKGCRFLLEMQKLTAMMVAQLCKLYLSKPASNHVEPFLARGWAVPQQVMGQRLQPCCGMCEVSSELPSWSGVPFVANCEHS